MVNLSSRTPMSGGISQTFSRAIDHLFTRPTCHDSFGKAIAVANRTPHKNISCKLLQVVAVVIRKGPRSQSDIGPSFRQVYLYIDDPLICSEGRRGSGTFVDFAEHGPRGHAKVVE
jgi:hypothetical protein